jgi:hypothetical protein
VRCREQGAHYCDKLPVQAFHYPFPGLAHLEKDGDGYRVVAAPWNPVI